MSRIQIILTEPSRSNALRALREQGVQILDKEFSGPDFKSAKYKFNGVGVEVHVDGNVYVYPAHAFSRIKVSADGVAE